MPRNLKLSHVPQSHIYPVEKDYVDDLKSIYIDITIDSDNDGGELEIL